MSQGRPPLPDRIAETYVAGSARGAAIVRGLLRSGRARPRRIADTGDQGVDLVRLDRLGMPGQFYWIPRDGSKILAGRGLVDADELSSGFAMAMACAGAAL